MFFLLVWLNFAAVGENERRMKASWKEKCRINFFQSSALKLLNEQQLKERNKPKQFDVVFLAFYYFKFFFSFGWLNEMRGEKEMKRPERSKSPRWNLRKLKFEIGALSKLKRHYKRRGETNRNIQFGQRSSIQGDMYTN